MPIAAPSRRSTRAQSEWNVPIATSRACSPTRAMMRARISAAALLVNVTARICHGLTPSTPIRYATRWASTRVLPEPAPARMSSGPSVVVTARACSGFSRATILSASASRSACVWSSVAGFSRGTLRRDENQSAKCGASSSAGDPSLALAAPFLRRATGRGSGESSAGSRSVPGGASGGGAGSESGAVANPRSPWSKSLSVTRVTRPMLAAPASGQPTRWGRHRPAPDCRLT